MAYIVGVDMGTTHCKAVVANEKGEIVFSAKRNCNAYTDDTGMHEQDAEEIYNLVTSLLAEVLEKNGAENIACVSFSAAMHSLLAVDKNGQPMMRALTWADTRAGKYAQQLMESAAGNDIYAQTGVPLHAMTPLCKLLWMKAAKPDVFNGAHRFISIKEYIFNKLFGQFFIDEGMASATGMFNLAERNWSKTALETAGITEGRLSKPVGAFFKAGALLTAVKKQLNVTTDLCFIAGSSDGAAAQLGSGALLPNEACVTIGTSGAVRTFIHTPVIGPRQKLFTYIFTSNWYFTGGPTNNGGNVMQWFAGVFLPATNGKDSFDKIISLAQQSEPGAKGLLFVPYLHGERAPVWDAAATGLFYGIKSIHSAADFARAAVEGVLLNIMEIFGLLPNEKEVDTIYANGGFFNNPFMAQTLADITGRKVLLQKDADSSAMGAVYMGMLATGLLEQMEDVKQFITTDETYLPDECRHGLYKGVFEKYKGVGK